MPARPKSICRAPACGKAIAFPGFCERHSKLATGWNTTTTASTTDRGYGHKWRKVRAKVLERDCHLCQSCARADRVSRAEEVDHIKNKAAARAEGWTEEQIDDPSNLEAICKPCHKLKTARENRQC